MRRRVLPPEFTEIIDDLLDQTTVTLEDSHPALHDPAGYDMRRFGACTRLPDGTTLIYLNPLRIRTRRDLELTVTHEALHAYGNEMMDDYHWETFIEDEAQEIVREQPQLVQDMIRQMGLREFYESLE